ncbi:hypothetical protein G6F22_018851 [Rhizopus arrhizus]|nr:hypothetical protein G6F22_018851 [Rhizopus arrhizus]
MELAQAVFVVLEVLGHAAFAVHAALEGDALQIALQVVRPLVIGADELFGVALAVAAELGAPVGAAVLEHVDRPVFGARDHHGRRPDPLHLEVEQFLVDEQVLVDFGIAQQGADGVGVIAVFGHGRFLVRP